MISLVQKYSGQTYRVYDEKGACKMLLNIGGDLLGWGPHFIVASWGKYNIILFDEKGLRYRNICIGDMTFVGTRPEARKFVISYKPEMLATLLLPAGITSEASIRYKDEAKILKNHSIKLSSSSLYFAASSYLSSLTA